jgi:MFS transporter, PAT family, beta-lactamase induction signal transducer AmpG
MILAINVFSSLQDVAIDALAIDVLPAKERGVANGFMFGSSYVGNFIGGAIIGGYLLRHGIGGAVLLEVCVLAIIAAFPLFVRERPGDRWLPGQGDTRVDDERNAPIIRSIVSTFAELKTAFSRRSSLLAAGLAACSLATTSAYLVFWPVHMMRVLGWSSEAYLALEGRYAVFFGLAGAWRVECLHRGWARGRALSSRL